MVSTASTVVAGVGLFGVRRVAVDRAVPELSGDWLSRLGLPDAATVVRTLESNGPLNSLGFDACGIASRDSGLVTFVMTLLGEMNARGALVERTGLPEGVQRLVALAEAVPEKQSSRAGPPPPCLIGLILAFVGAVSRFEGSAGRGVTLDARWRVLGRDGKEVAFKRTTLTEAADGNGVAGLVAAMNRAISRLGWDVSEQIQAQSVKRSAIDN